MTATATYIVDILDEHLDELGFLFGQWRSAQQDPDYTLSAVGELEERIRAHLQGVHVPGEKARPHIIELLEADDTDPDLAFAAAYALLHVGEQTLTTRVLARFAAAQGEHLAALTTALAHGPLPAPALATVQALLSARPAIRAAAAAEVLAYHDALQLTAEQLRYFLDDEDPATRLAGWRLAALLGADLPPKAYAAALRDAEPALATAALETGAWCGVPAVLSALRQLVEPATPERLAALQLLAVIGTPDDAPRIDAALANVALGPNRFSLARAFGAPALVPRILAALDDADPATAAAAGAAFERMTGIDIESNESAAVPPEDGGEPDEFDAEFQDEVFLPDAAKARREWEQLRAQVEMVPRLCRGVDATRAHDVFGSAIDMQSRRDICLRGRFTRSWPGSLLDLSRFPQGNAPSAARHAVSAA